MKLSSSTIQSFKKLWKSEFNEELTDLEAKKLAGMYIELVVLFLRTNTSQEEDDMQ